MLVIPLKKLKVYLILLLLLFMTNLALENFRSYTYDSYEDLNEFEYRDLLNDNRLRMKMEIRKSTTIKYLGTLPWYTIYIIYFGYFIVAMMLILSIKSIKDEIEV